jgi:hypothetical protein
MRVKQLGAKQTLSRHETRQLRQPDRPSPPLREEQNSKKHFDSINAKYRVHGSSETGGR